MNKMIRELFEKHTIPNFGPFNGRPHKNVNGEYYNPVIEDHWQTFQEAAELIVRECVGMLDDEDDYGPYSTGVRNAAYRIKKRFGVE